METRRAVLTGCLCGLILIAAVALAVFRPFPTPSDGLFERLREWGGQPLALGAPQRAILGTVLVDLPDLPGSAGSGSVLGRLSDGRLGVLTCWHVVDKETGPDIQILAQHPSLDAAVIALPDVPGALALRIRQEPLRLGEDVVACGYAFRNWLLAARGLVLGRTLSTVVIPGMSGGPVVDGEGHLAGIVSQRFSWGGSDYAAGLFVSTWDLQPWLRDTLAQQGIEVAQ